MTVLDTSPPLQYEDRNPDRDISSELTPDQQQELFVGSGQLPEGIKRDTYMKSLEMLTDMLANAIRYGKNEAIAMQSYLSQGASTYANPFEIPQEDIIPYANAWLDTNAGWSYDQLIDVLSMGDGQKGVDWAWSLTGEPTNQWDLAHLMGAFNPWTKGFDLLQAGWEVSGAAGSALLGAAGVGGQDPGSYLSKAKEYAWDASDRRLEGYGANPYGDQMNRVLGIHNWQDAVWFGFDLVDIASIGAAGAIVQPTRNMLGQMLRNQGRFQAANRVIYGRRVVAPPLRTRPPGPPMGPRPGQEAAATEARNLRARWRSGGTQLKETVEADFRAAHPDIARPSGAEIQRWYDEGGTLTGPPGTPEGRFGRGEGETWEEFLGEGGQLGVASMKVVRVGQFDVIVKVQDAPTGWEKFDPSLDLSPKGDIKIDWQLTPDASASKPAPGEVRESLRLLGELVESIRGEGFNVWATPMTPRHDRLYQRFGMRPMDPRPAVSGRPLVLPGKVQGPPGTPDPSARATVPNVSTRLSDFPRGVGPDRDMAQHEAALREYERIHYYLYGKVDTVPYGPEDRTELIAHVEFLREFVNNPKFVDDPAVHAIRDMLKWGEVQLSVDRPIRPDWGPGDPEWDAAKAQFDIFSDEVNRQGSDIGESVAERTLDRQQSEELLQELHEKRERMAHGEDDQSKEAMRNMEAWIEEAEDFRAGGYGSDRVRAALEGGGDVSGSDENLAHLKRLWFDEQDEETKRILIDQYRHSIDEGWRSFDVDDLTREEIDEAIELAHRQGDEFVAGEAAGLDDELKQLEGSSDTPPPHVPDEARFDLPEDDELLAIIQENLHLPTNEQVLDAGLRWWDEMNTSGRWRAMGRYLFRTYQRIRDAGSQFTGRSDEELKILVRSFLEDDHPGLYNENMVPTQEEAQILDDYFRASIEDARFQEENLLQPDFPRHPKTDEVDVAGIEDPAVTLGDETLEGLSITRHPETGELDVGAYRPILESPHPIQSVQDRLDRSREAFPDEWRQMTPDEVNDWMRAHPGEEEYPKHIRRQPGDSSPPGGTAGAAFKPPHMAFRIVDPDDSVEVWAHPLGLTKIISGGQTGADVAGLRAGRDLGLETGGVAPRGYRTADPAKFNLELRDVYGLTEHASREWLPRTRQNVLDSDGTILFNFSESLGRGPSRGSIRTAEYAEELNKPILVIKSLDEIDPVMIRAWIINNDIKVLNVAGNRQGSLDTPLRGRGDPSQFPLTARYMTGPGTMDINDVVHKVLTEVGGPPPASLGFGAGLPSGRPPAGAAEGVLFDAPTELIPKKRIQLALGPPGRRQALDEQAALAAIRSGEQTTMTRQFGLDDLEVGDVVAFSYGDRVRPEHLGRPRRHGPERILVRVTGKDQVPIPRDRPTQARSALDKPTSITFELIDDPDLGVRKAPAADAPTADVDQAIQDLTERKAVLEQHRDEAAPAPDLTSEGGGMETRISVAKQWRKTNDEIGRVDAELARLQAAREQIIAQGAMGPGTIVHYTNYQNQILSNFSEMPFRFGRGKNISTFTTAEGAYQAWKGGAKREGYEGLSGTIAKSRGRGKHVNINTNLALMRDILAEKYRQVPEFRAALDATYGPITHPLGDPFWDEHFPRLLMELRDENRALSARQAENLAREAAPAGPSAVETIGRYNVKIVRENPTKLYLFGDNLQETGKGNQAVIRGEPNALGIPTKKLPASHPRAYFTDDELVDNKLAIDAAFAKIPERLRKIGGDTVVLPEDGLGTGMAKLRTEAPDTADYLDAKIEELRASVQVEGLPGAPQAAAPTADFETLDFLEGADAELYKGAVTGINLSELDAEITDVAGGWAPSRLSQRKDRVTGVGVSPKTHVQADPDTAYFYTKHMYSKESGDVHDWSPMVTEIKERVEALTGYEFDLVLIQRYPAGETKLGWHYDKAQVFREGEHMPEAGTAGEAVVVSVNFGATREFSFATSYDPKPEQIVGSVDLGDGDVLVMMEGVMGDPKLGGYLHSLRAGSDIGPRINLTFRRISEPLQDVPRWTPRDLDLWSKAEREFDQGPE